MTTLTETRTPQGSEWFARWFDSRHYHDLYAHRDESEAATFIAELVRRLRPRPGATALDLGCGAGRHARRLSLHGLDVTGLDLSERSIRQAQLSAHPGLRFIRQDMREPFGVRVFDYVFSFFTSFGYFDDESDHQRTIRNVTMALKPGGVFVLDYLNVAFAESRLRPHEERRAAGAAYTIERWSDAAHFFKRIAIDTAEGERLEHVERVARFDLDDFRARFDRHRLRIVNVYGDYRLNRYDAEASPRLILLAKAA